jgi:hypothetical protein
MVERISLERLQQRGFSNPRFAADEDESAGALLGESPQVATHRL